MFVLLSIINEKDESMGVQYDGMLMLKEFVASSAPLGSSSCELNLNIVRCCGYTCPMFCIISQVLLSQYIFHLFPFGGLA